MGDGGGVLGAAWWCKRTVRVLAARSGRKSDRRQVERAQQGARVVGAGGFFAGDGRHGGLGAVGEQLDRIDEVFFLGPKLGEALFCRLRL